MTGQVKWKVTLSFSRFNAKYEVIVNDKTAAKQTVVNASNNGIWVVDPKDKSETYWGPESVAKGTISPVVPE